MARGHPDWYPLVETPSNALEIHVTFDPTAIPYDGVVSGAGSTVARDTTYALNGDASVRLTCGPAVGRYAEVRIGFATRAFMHYIMEFWVWAYSCVNGLLLAEMRFYDGANYHVAAVRYDMATRIWARNSAFGVWVNLAGGEWENQISAPPIWNRVRIEADFTVDQLISLESGFDFIPIRAPCWTAGTGNVNSIQARINLEANAAASQYVFIDDWKITQVKKGWPSE